jgi:hypothetical protein
MLLVALFCAQKRDGYTCCVWGWDSNPRPADYEPKTTTILLGHRNSIGFGDFITNLSQHKLVAIVVAPPSRVMLLVAGARNYEIKQLGL